MGKDEDKNNLRESLYLQRDRFKNILRDSHIQYNRANADSGLFGAIRLTDQDFDTDDSVSDREDAPSTEKLILDTISQKYSNLLGEIDDFNFEMGSSQDALNLINKIEETTNNLIKTQREKLIENLKKPQNVKFVDMFAFTAGVILSHLTLYMVSMYPHHFSLFYTIAVIPLMVIRYIMYSNANAQYFMLDFCYWAQVECLIFLWVFPNSPVFFLILFVSTNGPLIWAIPAWKNSLVFHDLDKVTSVFIHVFPALLTYAILWKVPDENPEIVAEVQSMSLTNWLWRVWIPGMMNYAFWQAMYLLKTEVLDTEKIAKNPKITTSFRYLSRPTSKQFVSKLLHRFKESQRLPVFVAIQMLYTGLTFLPSSLCLISFSFHKMYLAIFFIWSVWNGAQFYIEKFSTDYKKKIRKLERLSQDDFWNSRSLENQTTKYSDKKNQWSQRAAEAEIAPLTSPYSRGKVTGRAALAQSFFE